MHSTVQTELTASELEAAKASGDSDYYQYHAASNTHYYVIKTYPIPLLMPLDPFSPDSIIAALDAPLRQFIETAYDRTDYSTPTRASLFKPLSIGEVDAQTSRIAEEPAPGPVDREGGPSQPADGGQAVKSRGHDDDSDAADLEEAAEQDLESSNASEAEQDASEGDDPPVDEVTEASDDDAAETAETDADGNDQGGDKDDDGADTEAS